LNRQTVGMVTHGGFAKLFLAPVQYCYALPANIPVTLGALVEPLTTGAYALELAGFKPGDRVIVFGPGPIGQGTAVLASVFGAGEVAVVGLRDENRLNTLRAAGITQLFDMAVDGAAHHLEEARRGGFDVAIDATGVASVINQALGMLRPQGILAVAGMGEEPALIDMLKVVKNRLQIRGVSRMPPSVWPKVVAALAADPARFEPLVTHRLALADAMKGFELSQAGKASKVLLLP
jgi:threonine 3-dehydrogenase